MSPVHSGRGHIQDNFASFFFVQLEGKEDTSSIFKYVIDQDVKVSSCLLQHYAFQSGGVTPLMTQTSLCSHFPLTEPETYNIYYENTLQIHILGNAYTGRGWGVERVKLLIAGSSGAARMQSSALLYMQTEHLMLMWMGHCARDTAGREQGIEDVGNVWI